MVNKLTHFDEHGQSRMVNVGAKPISRRTAIASAIVAMNADTARAIRSGTIGKGDVFGVARLAGIMAAKNTSGLIPLCHPIRLNAIQIDFKWRDEQSLSIRAEIIAEDRTGVEMEALTAVSVCGLTVYDMCKSMDQTMRITDVQLEEKTGGQRGHFLRKDPNA